MTQRWINRVLDAAERGDVGRLEATLRTHWSTESVFLVLKAAAQRYGMSDAEMADELEDYLARYDARQTRH